MSEPAARHAARARFAPWGGCPCPPCRRGGAWGGASSEARRPWCRTEAWRPETLKPGASGTSRGRASTPSSVSYTHLRAHETSAHL
eukprot:11926367-Alexandrium_andersonii.AAC.1